MRQIIYELEVDGKVYAVPITFKRQRNAYLRAAKTGYVCTVPYLLSEAKAKDFVIRSLPILIKRIEKKGKRITPRGDNYTYLFGIRFEFVFSDEILKKKLLEMLTEITRKLEKEMNISKPYKIRVKNMSTRYGSNSLKTHSLSFQFDLVHYSPDIIRSVVVHELAHEFQRDHSKKFYNIVYKYCPNYWELKSKLRRGIY